MAPPPTATPGGAAWSRESGWVQPGSQAPDGPPIRPPIDRSPTAAGVPTGPPTFEQVAALAAPPNSPVRRRRKLAAATGLLGIGATVIIGLTFVTSGDDIAGGAESPEAAVTQMAEAISEGDALAAIRYLAPDELAGADVLVEKLIPYMSELSEEFADESGSDDSVFELHVEAVDLTVDERGDNAAIVSFAVVGDVTIDAGRAAIFTDPFVGGVAGRQNDFSTDFDSRLPGDGFDGTDLELVTVQLDGKWFISPFLSAGHSWVESEYLPAGEFELVGESRGGAAISPAEAVDRFYGATRWTRAADVAEVLGGGEGRFFHVFGEALDASELFSDGAFHQMFEVYVRYTLTEIDDGRVELDDVEISYTDDGSGDVSISFSDGCGTLADDWTLVSGCFSELFPPDSDVDDRLWFQTVEEDGGHRVTVLPTFFDVVSRFVGPYDAETIRWATRSAHADDPKPAEFDERIDIDFSGRRYVVHEFAIDDSVEYSVVVEGGHEYAIFTGSSEFGGFYETWAYDDRFQSYGADIGRVVVFSEIVDDCRGFECVPSGRGATSLTVTASATAWDDVGVLDEFDEHEFDEFEPYEEPVVPQVEELEEQPLGDPRLTTAMASTLVEVDGFSTWTVALPAGQYQLGVYSMVPLDAIVAIPGTACDGADRMDASTKETCRFEHVGGPVDVEIEIEGDAEVGGISLELRAIEVPDLRLLDQQVVSLESGSAVVPASFVDVPAGGVLVVATGLDGQDIVLGVPGDDTCTGKDHGIADGEVCYIEHTGGPLQVTVEGWSGEDRVGEAIIMLETNV